MAEPGDRVRRLQLLRLTTVLSRRRQRRRRRQRTDTDPVNWTCSVERATNTGMGYKGYWGNAENIHISRRKQQPKWPHVRKGGSDSSLETTRDIQCSHHRRTYTHMHTFIRTFYSQIFLSSPSWPWHSTRAPRSRRACVQQCLVLLCV